MYAPGCSHSLALGENIQNIKLCTILLEKKCKPSCGAWNCLVPTQSLFFYPVRVRNLNKLTIISRRRCYGSLYSSVLASSLVYLRGSELHMGTLVPADLPNQLREGFPTLPSLQVPKGPSHGRGCINYIIRLQTSNSVFLAVGKVIKRKQDTLSRSLPTGCGLPLLFVSP